MDTNIIVIICNFELIPFDFNFTMGGVSVVTNQVIVSSTSIPKLYS